jgi:hypothetical protein
MAKKFKIQIDAVVKGQEQVDELNESLETTQEETEEVSEGFSEMGGAADAALGGAVGKLQGFKNGIMSSVKSLGVMKVAIAATGLGLLLILIGSIKAAFSSTEEGQNKFAKIMNAIGVITGNLIDILADFGNMVISAFENPREAINNFAKAIRQNITNRIQALIKTFGLLGKTIGLVFKGQFKEAGAAAAQAGKTFVDVFTGVKDSVDKATNAVTGFIAEQEREIAVSNRLSDVQAQIDKDTRAQLVNRARLEGEIADLRLKAIDEENFSTAERLQALDDAQAKIKELFDEETRLGELRLEQIRERNKLSGTTKEDFEEEAQLEAALILLKKEAANQEKRIATEARTLKRELKAEDDAEVKAAIDLKKSQDDEALKLEKERAEEKTKLVEGELALNAQLLQSKLTAADTLARLAGEESKIGRAALLFKQFLATKELLIDLGIIKSKAIKNIVEANLTGVNAVADIAAGTAATAKAGFPIAIPLLIAYAATAAGIIASVSSAVSSSKSVSQKFAGGAGGIGGSASISAPLISTPSLAGISPASPADIGQNINTGSAKAFVVSAEMSTQQALDRRIAEQAGG